MKKEVKFFLLSLLLACTQVHAAFYDGNKLKQLVEAYDRADKTSSPASSDLNDSAILLGYVAGVYDSFNFLIKCKPNGLKMGQITSIVVNYVRAHPEKWGDSGEIIVIGALNEAFKCPDKK